MAIESIATDQGAIASLLTLTAMEIVLGIDNIVFISVIASKLPEEQQRAARSLGLAAALVLRILLLFTLTWIIGLTYDVVTLFGQGFSWRDIILVAGGLFLLFKATHEIHGMMEGPTPEERAKAPAGFTAVVMQIVIVDLVFSVDSVITAVGMAEHLWVMITAVSIAIGVMFFAAEGIASFLKRHPTTKMLALSFLLLVGIALVADGLGVHIPRGYIYFAMGFAFLVEFLNLMVRRSKGHGTGGPTGQGARKPAAVSEYKAKPKSSA
ncbi:MAG: TerC family protein [Pseudomonadota bacterium]